MGQVTVCPAVPECACWHCTMKAQPRYDLDQSAAQDAANMLGIERDVVINLGSYPPVWGAMAGWENDHWKVMLDNCKDRSYDESISRTAWHELGHVLDYERRIASGELIDPHHATHQMRQDCRKLRTYKDYYTCREERFARRIAAQFGYIDLSRPVVDRRPVEPRIGRVFTIPVAT